MRQNLRNGNKVFLFESKDIFINALVKDSYDYNLIHDELHKKLYFEEDERGKIKNTAVKQLSNFINRIVTKDFQLDKKYNPNSIKIYPIILLHNRQLEIAGLNKLVNKWFQPELVKLKVQGYNISRIREIVVINIDTLILYYELLNNNVFSLEELIDDYLKFCRKERFFKKLKNKLFKDKMEINNFLLSQHISFSMFAFDKLGWHLPSLFEEEGSNIFD